jgi:ribosomal protein S19E (S16A)
LPPRTETAPSRRLNWRQVRFIRRVYASGAVTMEALAALFGVAYETIWKIVHFETWRE